MVVVEGNIDERDDAMTDPAATQPLPTSAPPQGSTSTATASLVFASATALFTLPLIVPIPYELHSLLASTFLLGISAITLAVVSLRQSRKRGAVRAWAAIAITGGTGALWIFALKPVITYVFWWVANLVFVLGATVLSASP